MAGSRNVSTFSLVHELFSHERSITFLENTFITVSLGVIVVEILTPVVVCGIILWAQLFLLYFDDWVQETCLLWLLFPQNDVFLKGTSSWVIIKLRLVILVSFVAGLDVLSYRDVWTSSHVFDASIGLEVMGGSSQSISRSLVESSITVLIVILYKHLCILPFLAAMRIVDVLIGCSRTYLKIAIILLLPVERSDIHAIGVACRGNFSMTVPNIRR